MTPPDLSTPAPGHIQPRPIAPEQGVPADIGSDVRGFIRFGPEQTHLDEWIERRW